MVEELHACSQEDEDDVVVQLVPAIKQMLAALPDSYREALYLTEYNGLTQKALVAEQLGMSVSGAKSRVQCARQMLRHMLLECCHFELDQRNAIISYQMRLDCCTTNTHGPEPQT